MLKRRIIDLHILTTQSQNPLQNSVVLVCVKIHEAVVVAHLAGIEPTLIKLRIIVVFPYR